jgi:hypothetical protein
MKCWIIAAPPNSHLGPGYMAQLYAMADTILGLNIHFWIQGQMPFSPYAVHIVPRQQLKYQCHLLAGQCSIAGGAD